MSSFQVIPNCYETTATDDPSLADARMIIKVPVHQYRLAGGYDLEIGHF